MTEDEVQTKDTGRVYRLHISSPEGTDIKRQIKMSRAMCLANGQQQNTIKKQLKQDENPSTGWLLSM